MEKIRINSFTVSHYLAFLKQSPDYDGNCKEADFKKESYYPDNEETTLRSLKEEHFNWDKVRKLSTSLKWETLYCFTGWGL